MLLCCRSTPLLRSAAVLVIAAFAVGQESGHWAYQKPRRPAAPRVAAGDWVRNPIDAFVLQRLEADGIRPSPPAERARLLRRVYLDLTGLPPSVEQVDAFLNSASEHPLEDVVDDLLASPRFGEHWARQWLDLARYADSNGFQADQLRDSWAYRDWVIDALNRDMPFDEFSVAQLAGDLLPGATLAQQIATGFHRSVTCNVESGVDPEENRVHQVVDRVNTTSTVWLGTTMECAQCHDHKYDPFSQRDYYRLFAFFNNTPVEVKNRTGVRFDFYGPKVDLPLEPSKRQRLRDLNGQLSQQKQLRSEQRSVAQRGFEEWIRDTSAAVAVANVWHTLPIAAVRSTGDESFTVLDDQSVLVGGRLPGTSTYTVEAVTELEGIAAFRLETLTHESLPGSGPGRGDGKRPNFVLSEFQVRARGPSSKEGERVQLHSAQADYSQKGYAVAKAIDGKRNNGWAIGGAFFKDHYATFQTKVALGDGDTHLTFTLDQNFGRGRTIGRFRLSAYTGDPALLSLPAEIVGILKKSDRGEADREALRAYYLKHDPALRRLDREIAELEQKIAAVQPSTALVMVELEQPRETCVMVRGDYLQRGDAVRAGTPAVLHPFPAEWPKTRLGLARWLVSADNPLVARVTVNRWWARMFGRGLVPTEEDFGLRSEAPSHPELLDWLAVEFVESGWSMKHILRLIVTSSTYQQSSRRSPEDSGDVHNVLLARGPRFRMSAEMIRDTALSISGLLSSKVGGAPVYPPQPAGLWRQTGRNEPKYVVDTGQDRFRRGIYVIWRRAAPYPSFVIFDGPDRSTCHPSRSRTNTPMQALTLMNDQAFVEAALGLARRIVGLPEASMAARIDYAFRLAVARAPSYHERARLALAFAQEREAARSDPERAAELLNNLKALPTVDGVDPVELSGWFAVASILLNLDETISKG